MTTPFTLLPDDEWPSCFTIRVPKCIAHGGSVEHPLVLELGMLLVRIAEYHATDHPEIRSPNTMKSFGQMLLHNARDGALDVGSRRHTRTVELSRDRRNQAVSCEPVVHV